MQISLVLVKQLAYAACLQVSGLDPGKLLVLNKILN